jgi:hypothetical protein
LSNVQTPSPQEITYNWLRYAKDDYTSVQNGTAPFSSAGGQSAARFNWDVDTPRNPFWCYAIAMQFNLTLTLTIPAGGTVTLSPFAPYSGIGVQLTIGGGQAIQPMSLVPFWLDELTSRRDNDWTQYGPAQIINADSAASVAGVPQPMTFVPSWQWDGSDYIGGTNGIIQPLSITDSAGAKYYPGQVIPNSGGSALVLTLTVKFQAWMQLGRKLYGRNLEDLTGCIPMGDPANRPTLYVNIANLVGTFPEQNLFVATGSGGAAATAVTSATVPSTCQTIWVCKQLDQLPDNVSVGTPKVLSALEVNTNGGFAIQNAGQFVNMIFDTAMVYNKRLHVLVNNQLPQSADYFGIWYSENQSNARFFWDGQSNNLQEYFRRIRRVYGRNLPKGIYVADLVGGEFPEFPRETPYRGEIVTSTTLAGLTGLKPYPNAQTTIRIPSGTSMSGTAYVNTYSFGTVPVSY